MSAKGFVKHVVRKSVEPLQAGSSAASAVFHRRQESSFISSIIHKSSSGISPLAAIVVVGGLFILWLIVVCIGVACKFLNKPKSAAHAGSYSTSSSRLFQPSAAGYAARGSQNPSAAATPAGRQPAASVKSGRDGAQIGLLSSAQPMGRTKSPSVDPDETASTDASFSREAADRMGARYPTAADNGRQPNQHHRSTSSSVSISLTGPGMTPRRGGPQPYGTSSPSKNLAGPSSQPYDAPNSRYSPSPMGFSDTPMGGVSPAPGSGFRPGQVFNYSAAAGGPSRPSQRPGQGPAVTRSGSKVFRGPPPARQAGSRRSLYQTTPRIESIGQGLNRASKMFGEEENSMVESASGPMNFSRRSRANLYGAANYPSMGAMGGPMKRDVSNRSTIYGGDMAESQALTRALEDGFGSGQGKRPMGPRAEGGPSPLDGDSGRGTPLQQSRAALEGYSPNIGSYSSSRETDPLQGPRSNGGMRFQNGSAAAPTGLGFGPGAGPGPLGSRPRPQGAGGPDPYNPAFSNAQRQPVRYPAPGNNGQAAPGAFAPGGPRRPMGGAGPGQGGAGGVVMGMRQQYQGAQPIMSGGGGGGGMNGRQLL